MADMQQEVPVEFPVEVYFEGGGPGAVGLPWVSQGAGTVMQGPWLQRSHGWTLTVVGGMYPGGRAFYDIGPNTVFERSSVSDCTWTWSDPTALKPPTPIALRFKPARAGDAFVLVTATRFGWIDLRDALLAGIKRDCDFWSASASDDDDDDDAAAKLALGCRLVNIAATAAAPPAALSEKTPGYAGIFMWIYGDEGIGKTLAVELAYGAQVLKLTSAQLATPEAYATALQENHKAQSVLLVENVSDDIPCSMLDALGSSQSALPGPGWHKIVFTSRRNPASFVAQSRIGQRCAAIGALWRLDTIRWGKIRASVVDWAGGCSFRSLQEFKTAVEHGRVAKPVADHPIAALWCC